MGLQEEMPTLVPLLALWFALEAVLRVCWWAALPERRSEARFMQRCTALTINLTHAVGVIGLCGWVICNTGPGLSGSYDRAPCTLLPSAVYGTATFALRFSLSWAVWDLVAVLRDLEGEGVIMIFHAFVMIAASCMVLFAEYVQHAMISFLFFEASTPFLNIRKLLLTVLGKQAYETRIYHQSTMAFGISFLLVRVVYGGPRILVHIYPSILNLLSGNPTWQGCNNTVIAASDVTLSVAQLLLNFVWANKIIHMALRARSRSAKAVAGNSEAEEDEVAMLSQEEPSSRAEAFTSAVSTKNVQIGVASSTVRHGGPKAMY